MQLRVLLHLSLTFQRVFKVLLSLSAKNWGFLYLFGMVTENKTTGKGISVFCNTSNRQERWNKQTEGVYENFTIHTSDKTILLFQWFLSFSSQSDENKLISFLTQKTPASICSYSNQLRFFFFRYSLTGSRPVGYIVVPFWRLTDPNAIKRKKRQLAPVSHRNSSMIFK